MKPEPHTFTKADVERILGKPIHSFSTSAGAKQGDNVAGDLVALEILTSPGSDPLHLVYKGFPAGADAERRQFVAQFGIFHTETCMYEKILPRLVNLLKTRSSSDRKSLPIAKYISGFNDDENDYVCLEDLRPQGFKMQDKFSSLTLAEASMVMSELARFHALTHFLIRYCGESMFEDDQRIHRIKYNAITQENPMMAAMFSKMFQAYLENTVELLEPRDKVLSEHVQKFLEKNDPNSLHKFQRFNANRTDKTIFPCIVHGDLWTNNILFRYGKDQDRDKPQEVKFIDFQMSRRGNIYEDLGYFLWTSTTPAFRKLHLDTVLIKYFESFQRTMDELQFPMPQGFTKGALLDGFYQGILPAFLYMPFALGLQLGDLKYMQDPDEVKEQEENGQGQHEKEMNGSRSKDHARNGDDSGKGNSPSPPESPTPPAMVPDFFEKMMKNDKRLHKLRMVHSPRALDRLEALTREVVEMKLL